MVSKKLKLNKIFLITVFTFLVSPLYASSTIAEKFGNISPFDPFKKFYDEITTGAYSGVLFALITFMILYGILNIGGKKFAKGDKQLEKLVNIISFSVGLIASAGAYVVFKKFDKFQDVFWLFTGFFGFLLFNYLGYEFLKAGRKGLEGLENAGWTGVPNDPNLISGSKARIERVTGRTLPLLTILTSGIMFFMAGLSLMKSLQAFANLNNVSINHIFKNSVSLSSNMNTFSYSKNDLGKQNKKNDKNNILGTSKNKNCFIIKRDNGECLDNKGVYKLSKEECDRSLAELFKIEGTNCYFYSDSKIECENPHLILEIDRSNCNDLTKNPKKSFEKIYIYSRTGKIVEDGETYYLEGDECNLNDENIKNFFYCNKGSLNYNPINHYLECIYNGKRVASIIISKEKCK